MATINQRELEYRKMLINLDKLITQRELSAMKFQSKAVGIGVKNLDKIEAPLDLWGRLEERGALGIDNLTFLKDLLKSCTDNRCDVFDVVTQFEKYRHVDVINSTVQEGKEPPPATLILVTFKTCVCVCAVIKTHLPFKDLPETLVSKLVTNA